MNRQFVVPFPFPSRDYFTIEARQRAARGARALPLPPLGDTDRSLAAVKGISLESHASLPIQPFDSYPLSLSNKIRDARLGWHLVGSTYVCTPAFNSCHASSRDIHCLSGRPPSLLSPQLLHDRMDIQREETKSNTRNFPWRIKGPPSFSREQTARLELAACSCRRFASWPMNFKESAPCMVC